MIIEMPKDFQVQATGTINYQNILVKANFAEDRWVVAAEMRPAIRRWFITCGPSCGLRDRRLRRQWAVPGVKHRKGSEAMRRGSRWDRSAGQV